MTWLARPGDGGIVLVVEGILVGATLNFIVVTHLVFVAVQTVAVTVEPSRREGARTGVEGVFIVVAGAFVLAANAAHKVAAAIVVVGRSVVVACPGNRASVEVACAGLCGICVVVVGGFVQTSHTARVVVARPSDERLWIVVTRVGVGASNACHILT